MLRAAYGETAVSQVTPSEGFLGARQYLVTRER